MKTWYMVLDATTKQTVAYGILKDLKSYIGGNYIFEEI